MTVTASEFMSKVRSLRCRFRGVPRTLELTPEDEGRLREYLHRKAEATFQELYDALNDAFSGDQMREIRASAKQGIPPRMPILDPREEGLTLFGMQLRFDCPETRVTE